MKSEMDAGQTCEHLIYEGVNQPVLLQIPKTAKRLLDLGCGSGALGKQIKQEMACEVIGVTYSEAEASLARIYLDRVLVSNINNFNPADLGVFDCIVCSHILEHLYQPQDLLHRLHYSLSPQSRLIIALPNVLHWKQRLEFLKGNFKYTDGGLMDKTHFRFFDWKTARELLEDKGYEVIAADADGYLPLPMIRKLIGANASSWIDRKAAKKFPGLLGYQFIFSCRSTLNLGHTSVH